MRAPMTKCNHIPTPANLIERDIWEKLMSDTHIKSRCENCGMWRVWVEKYKQYRSEE